MKKRLIFIFIILLYSLGFSYALPAKQRSLIEKLMTEGSYDKALSMIEKIAPKYSGDPELFLLKGICCYKIEKNRKEAVPLLKEALTNDTEDKFTLDILYHLAQAYTVNEDYINAIKTYNQLQTHVPDKFKEFHKKIEEQIGYCDSQLKKYGADPLQHPLLPPADSSQKTEPPVQAVLNEVAPEQEKSKQYTIQICTMSFPLSDSFFKGQYGIKLIRVGDLYRYIHSVYNSLQEAQKDLPNIRKIYPDAFIREYDENKLGKAIDLNIEHIK